MPGRKISILCVMLLLVRAGGVSGDLLAQDRQTSVPVSVREALTQDGYVDIVAVLEQTSGLAKALKRADLPGLKAEVRIIQRRMLETMSPTVQVGYRFLFTPAVSLRVTSLSDLRALILRPEVNSISLDYAGHGGSGASVVSRLMTSVPLIGADRIHDEGFTGQNIVAAVLDSGIDTDHPRFTGRIVGEACFVDTNRAIDGIGGCPNGSDRATGSGSAEDDHGHGTNVSGILGADGPEPGSGSGWSGVAPGVSIVAVKTLDGSNSFHALSEIVAALEYVLDEQPEVKVVNMSLGTNATFPGPCEIHGGVHQAAYNTIRLLRVRGTIVFASSMNDGNPDELGSPACLSNVTAVGASNREDNVASFSNAGLELDVLAPGVRIRSAGRGGGESLFSGTSQATPHVAGCAALLFSAEPKIEEELVRQALLSESTIVVSDRRNGMQYPRLDCFAAFEGVLDGMDDPPEAPLPSNALLEIYPNPVLSEASLVISVPDQSTYRVEVRDVLGRRVLYERSLIPGADRKTEFSVNASSWPAGLYFVRMTGPSVVLFETMVVY